MLFAAGAGAIAAMPVAGLLPPRMGGTGPTLRATGPIFAALLAALPLMHVLSPGIAPLAICAFLFGVFNILVDVPMNAHASVVERRWGRAIMSSFHAAWSGGGLVGAAFGGLLISRGASAPVQLGVEAFVTFAIALFASFQIGVGDAHPSGTFFALPERRLIALGAIAFLSVFAEAAVNDWSTLYLSADIGMTPGAAAGGFSGYALMMFLGRAFGDGVVHRLGRTRVIALGALAVFAGIGLAVGLASPAGRHRRLLHRRTRPRQHGSRRFQRERRCGGIALARNRHGRHFGLCVKSDRPADHRRRRVRFEPARGVCHAPARLARDPCSGVWPAEALARKLSAS